MLSWLSLPTFFILTVCFFKGMKGSLQLKNLTASLKKKDCGLQLISSQSCAIQMIKLTRSSSSSSAYKHHVVSHLLFNFSCDFIKVQPKQNWWLGVSEVESCVFPQSFYCLPYTVVWRFVQAGQVDIIYRSFSSLSLARVGFPLSKRFLFIQMSEIVQEYQISLNVKKARSITH